MDYFNFNDKYILCRGLDAINKIRVNHLALLDLPDTEDLKEFKDYMLCKHLTALSAIISDPSVLKPDNYTCVSLNCCKPSTKEILHSVNLIFMNYHFGKDTLLNSETVMNLCRGMESLEEDYTGSDIPRKNNVIILVDLETEEMHHEETENKGL